MKDKIFLRFTPSGNSHIYDLFMKADREIQKASGPVWMGVDWAAGAGMISGEVISRHDNVVHVRFKTVDV